MSQEQTGRIKVVVDTNTLVDAIFHDDTDCANLFQYKHDGEIAFCMNIRTYQEAFRIFTKILEEIEAKAKDKDKNIFIDNKKIDSLFYKLANALWEIQRIEVKSRTNYCKEDPDDNKFIDCCIDGNIKYLISNDNHLLKLKDLEDIKEYGIKIMTAKEFSLELLRLKFEKKNS